MLLFCSYLLNTVVSFLVKISLLDKKVLLGAFRILFIQGLCRLYLRGRNLSFSCRKISGRQLMHLSAGRLIILDITLKQERQGEGKQGWTDCELSIVTVRCPEQMATTFLKLVTTLSQPVNLLFTLWFRDILSLRERLRWEKDEEKGKALYISPRSRNTFWIKFN